MGEHFLGLKDEPLNLNKNRIIEKIRKLSDEYGLKVIRKPRWQLSIGEQQRVEILKMLTGEQVLILDEPTSVLTPRRRESFSVSQKHGPQRHGIVLISHKIEEIMEVSDRLTILRKGTKVATVPAKGISKEEIAEMMVGHQLEGIVIPEDRPEPGETVLECRGVCVKNDRNVQALTDLTLSLRAGEVLGVAGVDGNGQEELCEVLAGLRSPENGVIVIRGRDITGACAREFINSGVSYIPADRKGVGLIPNMNLEENMPLKHYWEPPIETKKYFMDWKYITKFASERIKNMACLPRLCARR